MTLIIGAVLLIGAIMNWNWLCDPTGKPDSHRYGRGSRRVIFFLLEHGDFWVDAWQPEASPYDNIWGIRLAASSPEAQKPVKWRGRNLLGFALMEVRDELRRVTQNEMRCDWSMVWEQ